MVDTIITLHESTETSFTTNGLGALSDAILCEVTEERNGEFELEMEYPVTGIRYKELQLRRIIMAKPNPYSELQPFRIYAITKPINGIVTVNAEHISYDMSGYPVSAFVADTIQNAFINMKSASAVDCPFLFSTDKTTVANMTIIKPSSMRSLLGGVDGSILDVYGGEYEFDKYNVKLWNKRGTDRGVSIRYGKNLTDLKQEENCSSVYTGVYPFWYSEQEGLVQLDEKILKASGTYNFTRIYPLDLSQEWTDKPTKEQLKSAATSYMNANNIGVPAVSLTVSFIQLSQSMEYSEYALLEDVHLCDTVKVEFTELNVSATAKCIKTIYDAISNKYVSIELGETRSNLASTISNQNQAISDSITKTFMQQAIENATQLISGGLGGYVIMHSSTGGKHPDEILIMDTDDIDTAKKVWRWNKGGLGYSSTGYNGPFALAMTQDGQIVADFVKTGTMSANRINGGTLILGGKNNSNGTALIKDSYGNVLVRLDENGITLAENVQISYKNILDAATKITKDTVTTEYVNALKVKADSVDAEDVTGTTFTGKKFVGGTINIGNKVFYVDENGKVTASNMNISGGEISLVGESATTSKITVSTPNGKAYIQISAGQFSVYSNDERKIQIFGPLGTIWAKSAIMSASYIEADGGFRSENGGVSAKSFKENDRGYCMCGHAEGHTYHCDWDGTTLWFEVDETWVWNSSDKRLKKNIESIKDGYIDSIGNVDLVQYNLNRESYSDKQLYFGALAQDVVAKLQERGLTADDIKLLTKQKVSENDKELYYGMDYEQFLILRLAYDEKKIRELEDKMTELLNRIENISLGGD